MAFALVGSLGTVAEGTAPSAAFGQATTAGNLLVAWVSNPFPGTVSGSGTGWVSAHGTAASRSQIWYRPNCGASEAAPTFTCTQSISVRLGEFSGGATTSPVDQTTRADSSASPQTTTNPGADAEAGELVIGVAAVTLSKAGTHTTSHTYNNGASATGSVSNDATSTALHYRFSYGITTGNSAADTLDSASNSMNLSNIGGSIASFKLAAAGPAASLVYDPQPLRHLRAR